MGMCKWFFKDATKIQNGRQRSTPNFFVGAKNLKLKSEIIQILLSHFPQYADVQVIFLGFYWNSQWLPWISFIFSCGRKNWKIEISNNLHCTISLPTIWKYRTSVLLFLIEKRLSKQTVCLNFSQHAVTFSSVVMRDTFFSKLLLLWAVNKLILLPYIPVYYAMFFSS